MNLVLVGYRGTGKSTVAQIIAERLGWPCFDADLEIERHAGKSIAEIFATDGEASFRNIEARVVADLAQRDRCVLSLGGGAVMRKENREAIARQGRIVWLQASPETLWRRIESDSSTAGRRPNLTAQGGINEIIATLESRREVYRKCAHHEVDTGGKTPDEVADAILGQMNLV